LITLIRGVGIINAPVVVMLEVMKVFERRPLWDSMFKEGKYVERYSDRYCVSEEY